VHHLGGNALPNQDQDSFHKRVINALRKLDEIAQAGIRAGRRPFIEFSVSVFDALDARGWRRLIWATGVGCASGY
jgi:hypothetical protein